MNPGIAAFLFVLSVVSDVVFAKYTLAVTARKRRPAAAWSATIAGLSAIYVTAYIHSRWYVIPIAAGCALGTWLAVR